MSTQSFVVGGPGWSSVNCWLGGWVGCIVLRNSLVWIITCVDTLSNRHRSERDRDIRREPYSRNKGNTVRRSVLVIRSLFF